MDDTISIFYLKTFYVHTTSIAAAAAAAAAVN
jgi:hypothetical protein